MPNLRVGALGNLITDVIINQLSIILISLLLNLKYTIVIHSELKLRVHLLNLI